MCDTPKTEEIFFQNTTDIISINEALLVRFRTDDSISKSGFAATYYAYDRPESEELVGGEDDEDEDDLARIWLYENILS